MFSKVTRKKSKIRLGLVGPSGAGKTLGGLYLAYGITGDWSKVALIDTEHERGRFYANRSDFPIPTGEFLYASMTSPFSPEKYKEYVRKAAEIVGEDGVIVIDSFSHAWDNEGGVLDIKSQIAAQKGKNEYSAWDEAGKIQNDLINTILSVNAHTIVTMRAKMAYAMEQDERGKTKPVKIGLAPVQRENAEYEFDTILNVGINHIAQIGKDTTFLDAWTGVITPELGAQIHSWLDNGVEPERCTDCGKIIVAKRGRTVEQIIEGSSKYYGRKLCMDCSLKESAAANQKEKNDAAS